MKKILNRVVAAAMAVPMVLTQGAVMNVNAADTGAKALTLSSFTAIPADQTVTLTADATKSVTFKNRLKKFTAEIVKKDSETGTAQGDGTLSGAVYGIFNGEELVDTYTTDENGYFRTKEYICGDNWTLREISTPEGYALYYSDSGSCISL